MKISGGVWIDETEAVIISLEKGLPRFTVLRSGIEGVKRQPGRRLSNSKFNVQFDNVQRKVQVREQQAMIRYLRQVADQLRQFDELVLLGPSLTKRKLRNFIHKLDPHRPVIRRIAAAGRMTKNELAAWVKAFYDNKLAGKAGNVSSFHKQR